MSESFTQAGNFYSSVGGNVDMRRGVFTASVSLGRIVGNALMGPYLPLDLTYEPTNPIDIGFGAGWSFRWTVYDRDSRTLYLSTGDTYKISDTGSKVSIRQKPLITTYFEQLGDEAYRVVHKSGEVTLLSGKKFGASLKVPTAHYSPVGHKLSFTWDNNGSRPRIKSISDGSGVLVDVTYNNMQLTTTVVLWPGSAYERTLLFMRGGGTTHVLSKLTIVDQEWSFGYCQLNVSGRRVSYLNKITGPDGHVEEAIYTANGFATPACSRLGFQPNVVRVVQTPNANQPPMITEYKYSTTNHFGGGSTGITQWSTYDDNLFLSSNRTYTYWTTAVSKLDNVAYKSVTQKYNLFHLMISQETDINGNTEIEEHEYNYAEINTAFDKQKAQYQFPTKKTLRFLSKDKKKSKSDQITQEEYDEWGNITKKIDLDGTVTTREYYSAEGEEGLCPANPNPLGVIRFVKSEVTTPSQSIYYSPVLKKEYTYMKMDVTNVANNDDNHPLDYAVMPETVTMLSDGVKINSTLKKYINNKDDINHGRVESVKESIFVNSNNAGKRPSIINDEANCFESITSHTYSHDLPNRTMRETVTHVTHDGLQDQTASIRSTCEGHILEQTDALGVKTQYDYDKLFRVAKKTTASSTDYERQTTYSYGTETIGNSSQKTPFAIATSGTGLMAKTWYDGLRRTIQQAKTVKDPKVSLTDIDWRVWSHQSFDSLGRLNKITTMDNIPPANDEDEPFSIENSCSLYYDDWGQHFKSQFTNGNVQQREKHPISLQIIEKVDGETEGQRISSYDTSGLLREIVSQANEERDIYKREYTYDGLRRLRGLTDENGDITTFEYDDRHRVTQIIFPDGTKVERSYALFTEKPLITQISINGVVIGSREYDGLFRVVREEVGGRVTTKQYDGANPLPSSVIEPSGQTIKYTYIPELSNVIQTISVGDATQSFEYDAKTGLMLSAKQTNDLGSFDLSMGYDIWGRLTSESFFTPWASRSTAYTYSAEGLLLSYTDAGGETTTFSYDNYGRINKTSDGQTNVEITYDKLNRIQSWTVNSASESIQTSLIFDEFSREIQRDIVMSDGQATRLRQDYNCLGLIEKRTTSSFSQGDDTENILKTDIYIYDNRHRISKYVHDGEMKTLDEYGNAILTQEYTYDSFGNILTVITEFSDDEGKNVTTYYYKNENDPCQLTNISHTHPDYPAAVDLSYDASGRLISDHLGRTLSYDLLGRLQSVDDAQKAPAIAFSYDAHNQLRLLKAGPDGDTRERYYLHNLLVTEIPSKESADGLMRWMYAPGGIPVAQRNGSSNVNLFATDVNHSVLFSSKREDGSYDPFGNRNLDANQVLLQYNGEARDGVTDYYHLGNGYRAYSPILRRFTSPDSWSPFGRGGINPYTYVHNDPINFTDPSGHIPITQWVVLGAGVAMFVLGLLSGVGALAAVEAVTLTVVKDVAVAGVTMLAGGVAAGTEAASIGYYNTDTKKSDDLNKAGMYSVGIALAAFGLTAKGGVGKGIETIRDRLAPPTYEEAMAETANTLSTETESLAGPSAASQADADIKDLKNLRGGCLPQEAYMGRARPGQSVNIAESEGFEPAARRNGPQKVPSNPEHNVPKTGPANVPPPPEVKTARLVRPDSPPPPVPPHSPLTFSEELAQATARRNQKLF